MNIEKFALIAKYADQISKLNKITSEQRICARSISLQLNHQTPLENLHAYISRNYSQEILSVLYDQAEELDLNFDQTLNQVEEFSWNELLSKHIPDNDFKPGIKPIHKVGKKAPKKVNYFCSSTQLPHSPKMIYLRIDEKGVIEFRVGETGQWAIWFPSLENIGKLIDKGEKRLPFHHTKGGNANVERFIDLSFEQSLYYFSALKAD